MAPGWMTAKQLLMELKLTPGFLEYHSTIGAIPAAEKWGTNRIYSPEAADQVRLYVANRAKGKHYRSRTKKEVDK